MGVEFQEPPLAGPGGRRRVWSAHPERPSHLLLDVADLCLQPLDGAVELSDLHLAVLQFVSLSPRRDLQLLVLRVKGSIVVNPLLTTRPSTFPDPARAAVSGQYPGMPHPQSCDTPPYTPSCTKGPSLSRDTPHAHTHTRTQSCSSLPPSHQSLGQTHIPDRQSCSTYLFPHRSLPSGPYPHRDLFPFATTSYSFLPFSRMVSLAATISLPQRPSARPLFTPAVLSLSFLYLQ